jgi:hypothetical protein
MPYQFNISVKQDHIRVDVSGEGDARESKRDVAFLWKTIADTCRKENNNNILAVFDLVGGTPVMATYSAVTHAEQLGWSANFRLAVADLHTKSMKGNLYNETIAASRGYPMKTFSNEKAALEWLVNDAANDLGNK